MFSYLASYLAQYLSNHSAVSQFSFAGNWKEMSAGKLSSTLLLLLLLCIKCSHSGVKKIKIHVPYYVKHVHHYKKIYVPKVHVIKHEHHHKKEYDHHHHHHQVYKHGPYRSYDKSSHEYPDEYTHHETYYDDFDGKIYKGNGRKRVKPFGYRARIKEQYKGWKDVDGSDYSGEDEDYPGYRSNYYFKRRSGTGKDEDEEDEVDPHGEEEEDEDEEEEEEEHAQAQSQVHPVQAPPNQVLPTATTKAPLP